jgi:hypothetical protein
MQISDNQINIHIQNGRATIELTLPDLCGYSCAEGDYLVYLWDAAGLPAFCCRHPVQEEEPCVIQLLRPHLWEGVQNPYLYQLEIYICTETAEKNMGENIERNTEEKCCERQLPVRELQELPGKGRCLNGNPFPQRSVYDISKIIKPEKLAELVKMGANTVVLNPSENISDKELSALQRDCDRLGLLLEIRESAKNCRMQEKLFSKSGIPTDLYYLCMAQWSREPFVYICAGSLTKQPDGLFQITVYSNQNKVALLVNGVIFAFQSQGPEFLFQDIAVRNFPLMLEAEAGECRMAVTCYR